MANGDSIIEHRYISITAESAALEDQRDIRKHFYLVRGGLKADVT